MELMNGLDPYKILKIEWQDSVDLWPVIMHAYLNAPTAWYIFSPFCYFSLNESTQYINIGIQQQQKQ